jgi:hypothetical protein
MMLAVTHEEIRQLLPRYAGGTLPMTDADEVRGHLASGCTECLGVLYRMPVGIPRPPDAAGRGKPGDTIPPPAGPASGTTRPWLRPVIGLVVAVALVALAVAVWGASAAYW